MVLLYDRESSSIGVFSNRSILATHRYSNISLIIYDNFVLPTRLLQRPCNIRIRPWDGYIIVGILNRHNDLVNVVNVTEILGDRGFLHPYDAHFVIGTSGDFIVVPWNPGRIEYFRRVRTAVF